MSQFFARLPVLLSAQILLNLLITDGDNHNKQTHEGNMLLPPVVLVLYQQPAYLFYLSSIVRHH